MIAFGDEIEGGADWWWPSRFCSCSWRGLVVVVRMGSEEGGERQLGDERGTWEREKKTHGIERERQLTKQRSWGFNPGT